MNDSWAATILTSPAQPSPRLRGDCFLKQVMSGASGSPSVLSTEEQCGSHLGPLKAVVSRPVRGEVPFLPSSGLLPTYTGAAGLTCTQYAPGLSAALEGAAQEQWQLHDMWEGQGPGRGP